MAQGHDIEETDAEGSMRAILSNGARAVTAMITTRPVYQVTARAALMVCHALDGRTDGPSGFQAASRLVPSLDHALAAVRSRVVLH